MENQPEKPDIVSLVRSADESAIRSRLDEIEGEREALRVLLRSVRARKRVRAEQQPNETVAHG